MFTVDEIARVMEMQHHTNGNPYVVVGNQQEQKRQYGNAVTPPVMRLLTQRLAEVC